jgi:hypothetical protein
METGLPRKPGRVQTWLPRISTSLTDSVIVIAPYVAPPFVFQSANT